MNCLNVLSGGPGSGKTTVMEILDSRGYACSDEVGRKIIKAQLDNGGDALPWDDKTAFRDAMFREEAASYERYENSETLVFFDRGLIDIYAYSKLENLHVSEELLSYCQGLRYNSSIFMFPPWEEIYSNDAERKQNFSQAVDTYEEMVSAYHYFNYSLVEVPKAPAIDRVEFVLESMV